MSRVAERPAGRRVANYSPPSSARKRAAAKPLTGNPLLRPSGEARVVWFRSLATMVTAGINLDRALRLLAQQSEDKAMTQVSEGLADMVSAGMQLSSAMALYPNSFAKLQYRLVQMGERAGVMDKVLNELSFYEEKERNTLLKVKSALTYPAFIFAVAFLILVIVPPYMMEGLFQMIKGSGVKPPLITRIVMVGTNATRSPIFYFLLVAGGAAGWILLPPLLRKPAVKKRLARFILSLPVAGKVYRTLSVARFTRALAVQLDCGISPLHAIQLSADATDNPVLDETIERAIDGLREGGTVAESLEAAEFFPRLMIKMVQVGEESASLPDLLTRTAEMYESDLDAILDAFTALLEPMVMVVMGFIVGVLVLASMLPMMQVLQNL